MSENINVSFIPKKTLARGEKSRKRPLFGISFLISMLIALASIGFAASEYYSVHTLMTERDAKVQELVEYLEDLEKRNVLQKIKNVERFTRQVVVAEGLLSRHIAPSHIFAIIEETTPKQVSYGNFTYSRDDGSVSISMRGRADSYAILAATSLMYKAEPRLLGVELSGISFNQEGGVDFTFMGKLDPSIIGFMSEYRKDGAVDNEEIQDILEGHENPVDEIENELNDNT